MITIITVGKKDEAWIENGVKRFSQRLRAPWNIEWLYVPHSSHEGLTARQDESGRILPKLDPADFVILLDETGRELASPAMSVVLQKAFAYGQSIKIIIGGAYGVDERVQARANFVWSLSPLVFPHQLVRLILTEQIYRFQEIAHGRSYHHE